MSFFGVDDALVQTAAQDVVVSAEAVKKMRGDVVTEVAELRATGWLGEAAAAFEKAMNDWDRLMADVENDLRGIAQNMDANAKTYAAAREEARQQVNVIDSLINLGAFDKVNQ
ncbi:WXG100 family type VII secretion target [Nonomuraea typhae]|uniref:WXG100 family type VII secretion target n=1 Tax=Nonomuraea typhae TaxID=2603600 RepID=A0ABW7YZQ1_9ACTN